MAGTDVNALPAADVAVVGAGVAGSVAALRIAALGFSVAVLERRAPAPIVGRLGADPRTVALSPGSQHLIESVGAWPASGLGHANGPQPYLHMAVWDGDGGGELRFTVDDLSPLPPVLGHILELSALTSASWRALMRAQAEGALPLRVHEGAEVVALAAGGDAAHPHRLRLADGRTLDATVVVAADGANSPVRALAGGEVRLRDTGQVAIATVATHARPHDDTAYQVFRATGPLAFLPLRDRGTPAEPVHLSSVVWSCDAAYGEELMQLEDAAFLAALGSAFGDRLGALGAVDARTRIPLIQRQAVRYQPRPGVLLLGDAAHVVHPLAGQGMNLGLRDVRLLTEVLGRARGVPAALRDARLLGEYELRARAVNGLALGFMAGIQRLFASDHPLLRSLRSGGMNALGHLGPLRRQLAREAMGEGLLAAV